MTRTTTGLCVAAALGFAVSLGAQSPTSSATSPDQRTSAMHNDKSGHEVTVTGCLARATDGSYTLNNARMDEGTTSSRSGASSSPTTTTSPNPTSSPNPTTTTAGTTGTAGSTVGTTAAEPSGREAMTWKLQGGQDLDRHVGHKIQVTGHTEMSDHSSSSSPTTTTSGTTGTTAGSSSMHGMEHMLQVSSVKMISSSCQ